MTCEMSYCHCLALIKTYFYHPMLVGVSFVNANCNNRGLPLDAERRYETTNKQMNNECLPNFVSTDNREL